MHLKRIKNRAINRVSEERCAAWFVREKEGREGAVSSAFTLVIREW
jgi:hypothetical protein